MTNVALSKEEERGLLMQTIKDFEAQRKQSEFLLSANKHLSEEELKPLHDKVEGLTRAIENVLAEHGELLNNSEKE